MALFQRILVGFDGSEDGRRAVQVARELATTHGARLLVLSVVEPLPVAPYVGIGSEMSSAAIFDRHLADARRLADAIVEELQIENLHVESIVEAGRPADTIVAEAEKRNADLIVIGSHGRGVATRLLLGSVSDRVAHLADRPVLIVR